MVSQIHSVPITKIVSCALWHPVKGVGFSNIFLTFIFFSARDPANPTHHTSAKPRTLWSFSFLVVGGLHLALNLELTPGDVMKT